MELSQRQAEIAELVRESGFLSVDGLAERFAVTTQTIRRDLTGLCDLGLVRRRHGGVERPANGGNLAYGTRQVLNLEAKERIAGAVARFVSDGATLAFSIGTTPEVVARRLVDRRALRVFTNNLNVAMTLSANPSCEITIAGGRLRSGDRDVLGSGTVDFFSAYKVDIGIFGVAGVDEDGTLLDFHEDEVAARQAIRENCRASFLVLDHTKFGRAAHVRGGAITEVDRVVCDRPPTPALAACLAKAGTALTVADAEAGP
ncbi:DeoR family transcriptional regulator, glycerol-3-phosphate regulon repressor [Rhodospira trueperi]|uniref:DeoR family transcriptional regulator, glycerol-3-phosphate regulon repressor n=2 Tax=Rhodospira trueperi TaxID=69960 RepID=A0A1G7AR26_9PROT|nr:DeoR family transcriptional regulator, glycerol-3-phosphate regulon repressor [Rhodospira trueperi]